MAWKTLIDMVLVHQAFRFFFLWIIPIMNYQLQLVRGTSISHDHLVNVLWRSQSLSQSPLHYKGFLLSMPPFPTLFVVQNEMRCLWIEPIQVVMRGRVYGGTLLGEFLRAFSYTLVVHSWCMHQQHGKFNKGCSIVKECIPMQARSMKLCEC